MNAITTTRRRPLFLAIAAGLAGAFASPAIMAQDPVAPGSATMTPQAIYQKDRANCDAGRTAEDRATCLKEAGAAFEQRKHHQLDNQGTPLANATDRCNVLPDKDKAACLARIVGPLNSRQTVTTSGSVAGGGDVKETTTTTPGQVIVIMPNPTPAPAPTPASAPSN